MDSLYLPASSLLLIPVMSHSARPAKRRRAIVACNSCRHRKSRVRVPIEIAARGALMDSSVMGPGRAPSARSCNAIVSTKMLGHPATSRLKKGKSSSLIMLRVMH